MSRCFPFPPPGYEKRARVDDSDLLTKENRKEKKHKKDKKDKEKREGKEKKNKERSRDKKKDRKEKDKERDRDKQPECNNGENVEIKDSKYVQELARRIKDEDRAIGSQMVTDQRRVVSPQKVVEINNSKLFKDEKKINGFRNHIDPRILENERNSFGMDRARVDGKAKPADLNVEKKMEGKEKDKQNGGEKHKDRDKEKRSKSKDKDRKREKEKKEKVKKTDPSKEQPKDMTSSCIVKPSNNLNLGVREEVEMKKEPTKEQSKLKENINLSSGTKTCSDEGTHGKHKGVEVKKEPICSKDMPVISNIKLSNHVKEGIKSSNGEVVLGKRKEIEMKKEPISEDTMSMPLVSNIKLSNHVKEGVKSFSNGEGILSKRKEIEMKKEPVSKDIMSMPMVSSIKLSNHVKEGIKSSNGEGVLGKRKEPEMNGILNDNGTRPHKSPGLVTSSHPVENGRKKEPTQFTEAATSKKQRINGSVDAQPPYASSKRPSHATTTPQVNENGELCGKPKPPHPDSMYLNQILSIPKIEEVSDLDDQEWLFRSNNQQSKKPKVGSFEDRTSQVWAKGLQIESADIYALPYVTPY